MSADLARSLSEGVRALGLNLSPGVEPALLDYIMCSTAWLHCPR
jgi:hypothetical protein